MMIYCKPYLLFLILRRIKYEKMVNLNMEFIQAASVGNVGKLKECLDAGANIEFINPKVRYQLLTLPYVEKMLSLFL